MWLLGNRKLYMHSVKKDFNFCFCNLKKETNNCKNVFDAG